MKLILKGLFVWFAFMVNVGCNAPAASSSSSSASLSGSSSPAACAFDSLQLNGSGAADPAKTSYLCHSAPASPAVDKRIYIALRTDGSAYFGIGAAGGGVTPSAVYWGIDSATCEVRITTGPNFTGTTTYRLRSAVLGSGNKFSETDTVNHTTSIALYGYSCSFDTSPGY